ncbi:MAG: hypothetical protein OES09_07940, partial [Gammaproteobacteria bacterium]|nr:hypothetical protein [Gammaproteobacteria bacterium]
IVLAAGWFIWTNREPDPPPAPEAPLPAPEEPSIDTPPAVPDEPVVTAPPVTPAEPTVDTPPVTPSVSADAPNPHLPITLKEQHEYRSERWGYVDATVSDGRPAAVRGTFRLKSEHAVKGIKAYVLVQLLDKRGNVIKEVKARTWVSGKFVPNRSEHTVNFDEEISDSIRRDVVEARLKFVHEQ